MFKKFAKHCTAALLALYSTMGYGQQSARTTVTVGMLIFSPEQREVLEHLSLSFEQKHPNYKIRYLHVNDAKFKQNSNSWLTTPNDVDVLHWPWRSSMEKAAKAGLIESVTSLWQRPDVVNNYNESMKNMVTVDNGQYAIPYSSTFWGFYYRASLFQKLNLAPPEDWNAFLQVCRRLKENNITPIALSSKNPWPLAAWFDYFNLRINGLEFHLELLRGNTSFLSPKVRTIFEYWKRLIDEGCFIEDTQHYTFPESVSLLYRHHAGLILSGSFIWSRIAPKVRDDFRFFPFPRLDPSIPTAEEVPTDMLLIPKNSDNKEGAKAFLSFFMEAENQQIFNQAIQFIPVHSQAQVQYSLTLNKGRDLINSAHGTSQYLDRDASAEFAQEVYKALTEFINNGEIETTLALLEASRIKLLLE